MQQEIARRCKYTVAAFATSNTDLLTCVREQNCSCAHILPSHRSSLQWWTFVPAVSRFGVASRAQHRFVSAFLPASWPVPHKMCRGTGMYYGTNHIKFYGRKGPRLSSLYRFINTFPIRRTIAVRRRVLGSCVGDHADALALSFPDPLALVSGHAFSVPV